MFQLFLSSCKQGDCCTLSAITDEREGEIIMRQKWPPDDRLWRKCGSASAFLFLKQRNIWPRLYARIHRQWKNAYNKGQMDDFNG